MKSFRLEKPDWHKDVTHEGLLWLVVLLLLLFGLPVFYVVHVVVVSP